MKIFLVGMMGSGKSHEGKLLAKHLKLPFYDLDTVIEETENRTIAAIFEQDGEAYFRRREAELLRDFDKKEDCIVSTGGGTPCFNNNMQWMNEHGTTIWLNEDVAVLVKRLMPEKNHRPLIKNLSDDELHQFLDKKLEERKPFYNQAMFKFNSKDVGAKTLFELLNNKL